MSHFVWRRPMSYEINVSETNTLHRIPPGAVFVTIQKLKNFNLTELIYLDGFVCIRTNFVKFYSVFFTSVKILTPILVTWLSSWSCDKNMSIRHIPGLARALYFPPSKG
jgi:hypothetical protein